MSNIGSTDIIGKQLKMVITTATEAELNSFKNKSCDVKNAIIISVPQTMERDGSSHDTEGKITMWLSDNNGKLIQMTKSIDYISSLNNDSKNSALKITELSESLKLLERRI